MHYQATKIPEVILLTPRVFQDERGYFFESYNAETFKNLGISTIFVQDNQSFSQAHVLRGLHYQRPPKAQAKLIQVIQGEIFDVAVDLRPQSPTYKHWVGEYLSESSHKMLYIPEGFAHGFLVTSETAIITYKCSATYAPDLEESIHWNDPKLAINWPLTTTPRLSPKDEAAPLLP